MTDGKRPKPDWSSGAGLMIMGLLLVGLCGTCTWRSFHVHDGEEMLAAFGFLPIGLGVWLFVQGLKDALDGRKP